MKIEGPVDGGSLHVGIVGPVALDVLESDIAERLGLESMPAAASVANVANMLIAAGCRVHVFTLSERIDAAVSGEDGALAVTVVPARARHKVRDLFRVERAGLTAAISSSRPDVLHAQWTYLYAWASLSTGLPTSVMVRDAAVRVLAHGRQAHHVVGLLMDRVTLSRATDLTANSEYILRRLPRKVGGRTTLLPNTVEEELLARGAVDSASASDVVCLANGWCSWKNVAGALRAFSIVHRYVPEARLQLIGVDMGPEGPASEYAHREGLRDGVDFVGPLPHRDAVDRLARAAVYFHPSLEESFGQAVLEAMALGRPIVAHDRAGNVPYLLERGRFGLLCDARAPEEAAAAIIGLLEERDAAMRLGRAARAQARSCYSRAAVVGRYMAHYAQVLRAGVGMSGADAQDPDVGGVR